MLLKLLVVVAAVALINGANIKPHQQREAFPAFKHDALMANPLLEQRTVRPLKFYQKIYIFTISI